MRRIPAGSTLPSPLIRILARPPRERRHQAADRTGHPQAGNLHGDTPGRDLAPAACRTEIGHLRAFSGTIGTASLALDILSLGHNSYQFGAAGTSGNLIAVANPVPVLLTIGNDTGTTTVKAARLP